MASKKTPEGIFKDALIDGFYASYTRCKVDKVVQDGMTGGGRPDITVYGSDGGAGLTVQVELKAEGKKPRRTQRYVASEICKGGGVSVWCRPEKDCKVHWYDILDNEFLVTDSPADCSGVLEKCFEHIDAQTKLGTWDELVF